MLIRDIINVIETAAPLALQEEYDNSGLQVGSTDRECSGVLLCVDITPDIVQEAIDKGLNLIISHHPLIFKPIRKVTGKYIIGNSLIEAIKHDITVYASHTSMDNAPGGISFEMARLMGFENVKVLEPKNQWLSKLTVWIPQEHAFELRSQLFNCGCGAVGNYDNCSFYATGHFSFRPLHGSNPYVGTPGEIHYGSELRLEMLFPKDLTDKVVETIRQYHPYEQPAFEITDVTTVIDSTGTGAITKTKKSFKASELIDLVKKVFNSSICRCSKFDNNIPIDTIALCGGSGSFLIPRAISAGATAFITSDTKYHDFVDYADKILIIDIGHFESESCCKNIFYRLITEKFHNFAVLFSQKENNPIIYR